MSDTPPKNFLLPESRERYAVHTLDSFLLAEDNRTLCESIVVRRIAYHKAQQHPFHERVILELTPHDSESKRQDFPPCAYAERSRTIGDGSSCGSLSATAESSSVSVVSLSPDLAVPAKDVLHIPDRKNRVSFDKEVEPLKDTTALIRIVTLRTPPSLAQVVLMMQALHNQRPLYTIVDLTEVKKGGQCYWFAKMLCVALESKYDGQESAAAHKKLAGTYRSVSLVKSVKPTEVTAVLLKFDEAEKRYHVRQRKSVAVNDLEAELAEKTTALRLAEDKAAEFEEMADKERRRALQEARARAEADDQRNRLEHEVQILREKLNPQGMA